MVFLFIRTDEAAMLEKISSHVLKQLKVKKLWEEFRIRDVDQNHYITVQELHYAMTQLWSFNNLIIFYFFPSLGIL